MSDVIWKYPLGVVDRQVVTLTKGATMLCVQTQGDAPHLWAIVNDDLAYPQEERVLLTFGTGHPIDIDLTSIKHLSTYQMRNGGLVFHVFEYLGWQL